MMIAVGIIISLVLGVLMMGAAATGEEYRRDGKEKERRRMSVFAFGVLLLCVLTAYATGAYLR